ncbi:MAG: hypothetical protein HWE23_04435 [Rhodobacteraceae bacterium]|nr:hypothetical protein [Paracoccaceae bacterium]
MKRLIQMQAATRKNRFEVGRFVVDQIGALDGWVEDVQLYSNKMSTTRMTLPVGRYRDFVDALNAYGVPVELPDAFDVLPQESAERSASLQISFVHEEPDTSRPLPAVPG